MDQGEHIADLTHQMDSVIAELREEIQHRESLEKLLVSLIDRLATLEYRERLRLTLS